MKKIIALLLALIMAVSMVACNTPSNNPGTTPGTDSGTASGNDVTPSTDAKGPFDEHVTLKYIFVDPTGISEYAGWQRIVDAVNAITKEKINATIDIEVIPLGEFNDKMAMKYLGGEEFDVVFTGAWNNYAVAVGQGAYAELTPEMLETYAADTMAVLNESSWEALTIDGKIYGVPLQQIWVRQMAVRFNVDKAKSYNFDYTKITDLADIEPYLQALKAAGEEFIFYAPFAGITNTYYLGYDVVSGPGAVVYDAETPVVENMYASKAFADYAKLMKKWYDAGYIHPEVLTDMDKNLFAVDLNPAHKPGGDATETVNRGYNIEGVPVGGTALATSGIVSTNLAVGATSKNPERALAFINLLNTDAELLNLLCHGIEGTDWEFVDKENGVIKKLGEYPGNLSFLVGNVFNEYYVDASQVGSWEETAKMNAEAPGSCILGFTFNTEPVSTELANINAVVSARIGAIITGQVDDVDAAIADMNKALEDAGLSTVLAEMQSQIDEWLESK